MTFYWARFLLFCLFAESILSHFLISSNSGNHFLMYIVQLKILPLQPGTFTIHFFWPMSRLHIIWLLCNSSIKRVLYRYITSYRRKTCEFKVISLNLNSAPVIHALIVWPKKGYSAAIIRFLMKKKHLSVSQIHLHYYSMRWSLLSSATIAKFEVTYSFGERVQRANERLSVRMVVTI